MKIRNTVLSTEYNKQDLLKFTLSLTIMGVMLYVGIIFYLDSFLTPGLLGLQTSMDLGKNWLEEQAKTKGAQIGNEINNIKNPSKELIMGFIDTGVEEVNTKANQLVVTWIAIGFGLVVPLYVLYRVVVFTIKKFEKMIKFDSKKRILYEVKDDKS